MVRKVIDGLAVASFLLSAAFVGGGIYSYMWITSEDNQKELLDSAVEKIKENLPIPSIPEATGPALPF
tara:strand:+ start:711 stop:914 length:204 start_codon:yes stop_codon:yes gene_type:complete